MTNPTTKITAVLGAALLLAVAGIHFVFLEHNLNWADRVSPGSVDGGLREMSTVPPVHWLFIAFLSFGLSRYKSNSCAAILMAFGVMILIDAMLIASGFGLELSTYLLGAAGALLLISGLALRRQMRAGL